jgi:hypothetical protein
MLFTTLLLPLAASAAVLHERDSATPQVANIVVEKLEPKYRKTANKNRYKLGRKWGPNINVEVELRSISIYDERG